MYSLAWPNMFTSAETKLLADKKAIASNLILLLNSEKMELFGDPYFGTLLKQLIFQPNNTIIIDLLADELLTTIQNYMPQIYVTRDDITIKSNKVDLLAEIKVTYKKDSASDLYTINLTNNEQEG